MASNATITNEKRAVFIDTTPSENSASYNRVGEGINTFTPSNNGTISTKHYINDKFATSRRNGLQKQWAFSGDRVIGDNANDFLVSLTEKTGSDVETTLIIADLIGGTEVGTGASAKTYYSAKKYDVMVDVTNDGSIEGGQDVAIDGTIYANGDPSTGYIYISSGVATWADSIPSF